MGGWIKLHNEELHNLYSSPNHNDQVKGEISMAYITYGEEVGFWWESRKGRDH
jgi:hypothetical protein